MLTVPKVRHTIALCVLSALVVALMAAPVTIYFASGSGLIANNVIRDNPQGFGVQLYPSPPRRAGHQQHGRGQLRRRDHVSSEPDDPSPSAT